MRVSFLDTSTPTVQYSFMGVSFGSVRYEIDPAGGDYSRVERGNVALLNGHSYNDVLGSVREPRVENGVASVAVRFRENDERAQAIKLDIQNGTYPRGVSAGLKPVEYTVDIENAESDDPVTVLKVSRWEMQELSLATVGVFGGVGFSKRRLAEPDRVVNNAIAEVKEMADEKTTELAAVKDGGESATVELAVGGDAGRGDEIARIVEFGQKTGNEMEALAAIKSGENAVDFMTRIASQTFANKPHSANVERELANRQNFSLSGFIESRMNNTPKSLVDKFALEVELQDKWLERLSLDGGSFVPPTSRNGHILPMEAALGGKLDLALMGVADYGTHAVPERTLGWIERYAAESPVLTWASTMDGLTNETEKWPRLTGGMTVEWTDDKSIATDSTPGLENITMEPHQMSLTYGYTRLINVQTGGATDMYLRQQASKDHISGREAMAVAGVGTGNTPRGIARYPNIQTLDVGSRNFDRAMASELEEKLDQMHVTEDASWAYLLSSEDFRSARDTKVDSGSGIFLAQRPQRMPVAGAGPLQQSRFFDINNFYPAARSSYIGVASGGVPEATAKIVFGRWSDFVIGTWSQMEVIVDPFTRKPAFEITLISYHDTAVIRDSSFVRAHSS